MRILHTADWHIGQQFYEQERIDEHRQFLDWLLETIKCEKVELLIVSGDIFDTSLPSGTAVKLYYEFLHRFSEETEAYAVITAGNHDSPRHLAAPKDLLKRLRIYVVGRTANAEDCVFKFPSLDNPRVAVAAVPYLSANELARISFETEVKKAGYREQLKKFYQQCVDAMPAELPKILMGHLFVRGGEEIGSERHIQIGGATAIHVTDFPKGVDYVALGHLHQPQEISGASYPVRYSGSPLPLRFNEATYRKKVCLLEVSGDGNSPSVEEIKIPVFRKLCTVKGDLNTVLKRAREEDWEGKFIRVELTFDTHEVATRYMIQDEFQQRGGHVLDVLRVKRESNGNGSKNGDLPSLEEPLAIFKQFYMEKFSTEPDDRLIQTFVELWESVKNNQS